MVNSDNIFTKEEMISGLKLLFPTFEFKFIDNEDGTFVLSANGLLLKHVVWSEIIGKELVNYFGCDAKSEIFSILERTIARNFDFDGTNWVEVKPKYDESVLGYYGKQYFDSGHVYAPYIPVNIHED